MQKYAQSWQGVAHEQDEAQSNCMMVISVNQVELRYSKYTVLIEPEIFQTQ